jgi:hypothetical protein
MARKPDSLRESHVAACTHTRSDVWDVVTAAESPCHKPELEAPLAGRGAVRKGRNVEPEVVPQRGADR